jgi:hypothetical protein
MLHRLGHKELNTFTSSYYSKARGTRHKAQPASMIAIHNSRAVVVYACIGVLRLHGGDNI